MYTSTIPMQRVGVQGFFAGRLSLIAIVVFLLCSAGIALATAVFPTGATRVSEVPAVVDEAETELKDTLDTRVHMHLKKLSLRG